MIFTAIRWVYLLPLLFLIFSSPCLAQEKYLPYPGIIHIHSHVSHKVYYSLRRLVSLAQDKGIKILLFTDTYLARWEYGLPVFSNIFKISREEQSVVKYGVKRYLEDLKKIEDEFPDMLILEGVEVAPFYWWSGSPFKKNLIMNDWHRHLLVVGLEKYQDYVHLPVVCNRYILPQLKDIPPLLIPISLIILGMFLLKKKQRKLLGLALNAVGILFLFHFFPFSSSRYNPYFGDKQYLPYQDLINYVHKKGGLVFWAHPEITEKTSGGRFATINFYTSAYPESLILTSGYTGFEVNMIPGTSHNLILAQGEWDNILTSYCAGKRSQPVWAICGADYRGKGPIDSFQNIFFLPRFSYESVYEALHRGRLYIRYHSENNINISLSSFHIEDSQNKDRFAFMGDEIGIKGKPKLYIKGSYKIDPPEDLKIEVICNGKIIKKFEFSNEGVNEGVFDLEFHDDSKEVSQRKSYYRLNFFAGDKIILVTNPIFVKMQDV